MLEETQRLSINRKGRPTILTLPFSTPLWIVLIDRRRKPSPRLQSTDPHKPIRIEPKTSLSFSSPHGWRAKPPTNQTETQTNPDLSVFPSIRMPVHPPDILSVCPFSHDQSNNTPNNINTDKKTEKRNTTKNRSIESGRRPVSCRARLSCSIAVSVSIRGGIPGVLCSFPQQRKMTDCLCPLALLSGG